MASIVLKCISATFRYAFVRCLLFHKSPPTLFVKTSGTVNNQWFMNGVAIKDATAQVIKNVGGVSYTVRVTGKVGSLNLTL